MTDVFRKGAHLVATAAGTVWAFGLALLAVAIWAVLGPWFHFSDTWQLVINTSTTIITFLMVFLIQNTQNRDARALHLKIDELLRTSKGRNWLIQLEELPDEDLKHVEQEFRRLLAKRGSAGKKDVDDAQRDRRKV